MNNLRYCKDCQDYKPRDGYTQHMAQHNIGNPAIEHKQYTGQLEKSNEDYMICVLHQKKAPCPIKTCKYVPFGMIRKSRLMEFIKNGVWIGSDVYGKSLEIPIDVENRTVILYGATIFLKA